MVGSRLMGHGQYGAVELGEREPAGRVHHDLDAQRLVQPQDGPGLAGTWRVVVAGDHYDRGVGQRGAQALQLLEQMKDGRIGGSHGVEDVARDQDQVGLLLEQVVHRAAERVRHVRLALVGAARRQPVELPEPEVQVRQVRDLQPFLNTAPPRSV